MPNKSFDGSDKSKKSNPAQESPLYDLMRRQAEGRSSAGSSSEGINPRRRSREPGGSSTAVLDRYHLTDLASQTKKGNQIEKDSQAEKHRIELLFRNVDSAVQQRVAMPLDLPIMQRYRAKRDQVSKSIKEANIETENFEEYSIEAKIGEIGRIIGEPDIDRSRRSELKTSLKEAQEWREANEGTTEQLLASHNNLDQRREKVKALTRFLLHEKEVHPEHESRLQGKLDRLDEHKKHLDKAIRAHNIFIKELRYELDIYNESRDYDLYLAPHQSQRETGRDENFRRNIENSRLNDCSPLCITRIMRFYHPEIDSNKVYERVYHDYKDHDIESDGLDTIQEAKLLTSWINRKDQNGGRIHYLAMEDFSFEQLEDCMKTKDSAGNNLPVILGVHRVELQKKNYRGYNYTEDEYRYHSMVARLSDDNKTYELWTPEFHRKVEKLEHLYDITFVEHGDGTVNEAVVPVSEQQYREVESQRRQDN